MRRTVIQFAAVAAVWGAAAGTAARTAIVQTTGPSGAGVETRFGVPKMPQEIERALGQLDAELAALAPTTQPATTQPTTQPDAEPAAQLDGWRLELWRHLQEWRSQVQELDNQTRALEVMSQDGDVARLTQEIAEWKEKTAEVESKPAPESVTDEMAAEAVRAYEEHNQAIDALTATVTQQESLLQDGFKAQRSRLQAELNVATARKERVESTYEVDAKAAETDAAREIVELRRRTAAARAAALETARAALDLKERRTQQEMERNKLRRDAMRPYVVALRLRMNRLIEEKSRTRAERLQRRIESADTAPADRAFARLELLKEQTVVRLQQEYANAIRDRFQVTTLQRLTTDFERDELFWEQFSASLARRTAADVLAAYGDAGREWRSARRQLSRLQGLLDHSISEQRELEDLERSVLEEYDRLAAEFRALIGEASDEASIRRTQAIGQTRLELRNAFQDLLKLELDVIGRLTVAVEAAERNVALWERASSRLYWSHLVTRGPTYFEPQVYAPVSAEVRALIEGELGAAWSRARRGYGRQWHGVGRGEWALFAICALAAVGGAGWLWRRCREVYRRGPGEEGGETAEAPSFARRLRWQAARAGRAAIPALLAAGLLALFDATAGLVGLPRRLTYLASGLIACVTVGLAAPAVMLHAPKARFRVIPCSNAVARHYRRLAYALLVIGVALLGPSYFLDAVVLAPHMSAMLVEWFELAATAAILLFMLRRETVLNVFPRAERGRLVKTVTSLRAVYPMLLAFLAALIVMDVAGYRSLSRYLRIGTGTTLALALGGWMAYELASELVAWLVRNARRTREAYARQGPGEGGPAAGAAEPSAAGEAAAAAPPEPEVLPAAGRAALSVVRWGIAIVVILVSLDVWGIRPFEIKAILDFEVWHIGERPVTVWRLGGAVVALVAGVFVSRVVRQTLETRIYPRHPAIDRGAQATINTLLHYTLIVVGVYVGLQMLRVDFTAIAVLMGGLGLGIGLGLQPLVVNFISGLLMLFERHVKVGDVVIVHDKLGEVTKVSMRSTTIRTPDGIHLVIPNGEFINQKVENWTLTGQPLRGLVDIGVAYGSDPRRVRDILLEIANAESRVLRAPPPEVFFVEFGESSLNFRVAAWFRNPPERWYGMIAIRYAIFERFRQEGIEIPFPQRTLSMLGGPLEVRLTDGTGGGGVPVDRAEARPK